MLCKDKSMHIRFCSGGKLSHECTLILTEGDSAKASDSHLRE